MSEKSDMAYMANMERELRKADGLAAQLSDIERELAAIKRDVPTLHQRRCWNCGKTHWHADGRTPYVLCPGCNSQDTRKVIR